MQTHDKREIRFLIECGIPDALEQGDDETLAGPHGEANSAAGILLPLSLPAVEAERGEASGLLHCPSRREPSK